MDIGKVVLFFFDLSMTKLVTKITKVLVLTFVLGKLMESTSTLSMIYSSLCSVSCP